MTKRILVIALLPLFVLDVTLALFETQLSGDVAQIRNIQANIRSLASHHGGLNVLVVGNSLIGEALDTSILAAKLSPNTNVYKAVPDGSNIWDWYCMLSDPDLDGDRAPDVIVIAYAWDQVTDQSNLDITRSFGHLCDVSSLSNIGRHTSISLESKIQAVAVKASSIYRLRNRIRDNLLDIIIPNYAGTLQQINTTNNERQESNRTATATGQSGFTYGAIRDLRSRKEFLQSKFLLVAMPVKSDYFVDAALCTQLADSGIAFIDMRRGATLGSGDYRDPIHLNSQGREKFSEAFSKSLRDELNQIDNADVVPGGCQ